jgi:hypothetical protein
MGECHTRGGFDGSGISEAPLRGAFLRNRFLSKLNPTNRAPRRGFSLFFGGFYTQNAPDGACKVTGLFGFHQFL